MLLDGITIKTVYYISFHYEALCLTQEIYLNLKCRRKRNRYLMVGS